MDFAKLRRGGDRGERGVLDGLAIMFDPNQSFHFKLPPIPFGLSLSKPCFSLRRTALRQAKGERGWNILAMDSECLQLGNKFIHIGDLHSARTGSRVRTLYRLST